MKPSPSLPAPTPAVYHVGRKNSTLKVHIAVPTWEDSVSRQHLELTVTKDGRFFVNDLDSASGTFRRAANGGWERIGQGYLERDQPIRLGSYETTVAGLLLLLPPDPGHVAPFKERKNGKAFVNPETGEVEYE